MIICLLSSFVLIVTEINYQSILFVFPGWFSSFLHFVCFLCVNLCLVILFACLRSDASASSLLILMCWLFVLVYLFIYAIKVKFWLARMPTWWCLCTDKDLKCQHIQVCRPVFAISANTDTCLHINTAKKQQLRTRLRAINLKLYIWCYLVAMYIGLLRILFIATIQFDIKLVTRDPKLAKFPQWVNWSMQKSNFEYPAFMDRVCEWNVFRPFRPLFHLVVDRNHVFSDKSSWISANSGPVPCYQFDAKL